MTTINCRVCGRPCPPGQRRHQRCPTCAAYWQARHTERPEHLILRHHQRLTNQRIEQSRNNHYPQ